MERKIRLLFLGASFLLGVVFIWISFLTGKDSFRTTDYKSMVQLQKSLGRELDLPFSLLTLLGSTEITLLILLAIFLSVLLLKHHLFFGLFFYFSIYLVELFGKLFIFHLGPPSQFNRYALGFHFPSSFIIETDFSYPSGHMARSTFLSIILLFLLLRKKTLWYKKTALSLVLILFLIAMFISRIYLGEHWFSDVVGGVFLGLTLANFTISFW